MKDVFYISQVKLKAIDIADILTELGFECTTVPARSDDWLTVRKDQLYMNWDFVENQKADIPFESEVQKKYDRLSPQTLILISYHTRDIVSLQHMLNNILAKFSGWVACDDDWQLLYTKDNIHQMSC